MISLLRADVVWSLGVVLVVVCAHVSRRAVSAVLHFRRQRVYRTEYLHSEHWRQFRHEWWLRHPEAGCVDCGRREHPLDLHHVTYLRRGRERDDDVVPVCRRCHDARHGKRLVLSAGRRASP